MATLIVQPYLLEIKIPLFYFGVIWPVLNLTVAATALYAYKIEKRLKKVKTLIVISVVIPLGFISLGSAISYWGILILFIFYIFRGFATPVLKDYINQLADSEIRATVLSVRNFVIRIFFAIIGPIVGWCSDQISLQAALLISGGIFLVITLITLIFQIRTIR